MPLLHIKLNGPRTRVNIPSSIPRARFKLKSYRVIFNRNDHGYYHASVNCSLFNTANMMSFSKTDDANYFSSDIPLFLDPENKLTSSENVDLDLGEVQNAQSSVEFFIEFFNCIERKRYDQAFFESNDPRITGLYGKAKLNTIPDNNDAIAGVGINVITDKGQAAYDDNAQRFWGTKIPMYLIPYHNYQVMQNNELGSGQTSYGLFADVKRFDANGNDITATSGTGPYPSAKVWVHTGVQVGRVHPQPGNKDYTTDPVDQFEYNVQQKCGDYTTDATAITEDGVGTAQTMKYISGSGYRKGAIPYAYSIDLVFEIY